MLNLNNLFDADSLPVAPEFVEVLAEDATETAVAALEAIHAPEHLIDLVRDIYELGYYLEACYHHPNPLLRDHKDRFDIEGTTIETINLIAKAGGIFHGPFGDTRPRESTAPIQVGGPK